MDHSTTLGEASWRISPSDSAPASSMTRGPYAASHTGTVCVSHGKRTVVPWQSTSSPRQSARIMRSASRNSVTGMGGSPSVRTALSPRPTPSTARPS